MKNIQKRPIMPIMPLPPSPVVQFWQDELTGLVHSLVTATTNIAILSNATNGSETRATMQRLLDSLVLGVNGYDVLLRRLVNQGLLTEAMRETMLQRAMPLFIDIRHLASEYVATGEAADLHALRDLCAAQAPYFNHLREDAQRATRDTSTLEIAQYVDSLIQQGWKMEAADRAAAGKFYVAPGTAKKYHKRIFGNNKKWDR